MARGHWLEEGWQFGRIYESGTGKRKRTYFIRVRRAGRLYEISTGKNTERAAMKEWERFDLDPEGYAESRFQPRGPAFVQLDDDVAKAYVFFCLKPEAEGGKGNSRRWVYEKKRCVAWWMEQLLGRDLRRVTADVLTAALEPPDANGLPTRVPGYPQKIEVIKDVFAFLRTRLKVISRQQDPTLDLLVPQARPGTRRKKVKSFTRDVHEKLLKHVLPPYSWALTVLAGTGWHVTEVGRFVRDGAIDPMPPHMQAGDAAGVLVCPMHKSGDEHRTAVTSEVLAAAKKLREHGGLSESRFYKAVRAGCRAARIDPVVDPGQYRHAVATWAIEAGAAVAAVSAFLGHRSPATTKRFYTRHAVTPRVPTLA
jgi:integrase